MVPSHRFYNLNRRLRTFLYYIYTEGASISGEVCTSQLFYKWYRQQEPSSLSFIINS